MASSRLTPADETIVEWRTLTVAPLDEIAPMLRAGFCKTAAERPLDSILESGIRAAGMIIAPEKRADGNPPLLIASDEQFF